MSHMGNEGIDENVILKLIERRDQENGKDVTNSSCGPVDGFVNSVMSIQMSRDQKAGRIHSVRMDNSTFERVEEFKNLGTTLTNQNAIREEIKEQIEVRKCVLLFDAESFVF